MSKTFSIYSGSTLLASSVPEASLEWQFSFLEVYCGQRRIYLRAVEERAY